MSVDNVEDRALNNSLSLHPSSFSRTFLLSAMFTALAISQILKRGNLDLRKDHDNTREHWTGTTQVAT